MHLVLLIQLAGNDDIILFFLIGRRYIALLKQMGGCFALIGKDDGEGKPLYKEQKFHLEDIELSEVMTINQTYISFL